MSDLTDEELDQRLWAELRLGSLPRTRSEALQHGSRHYFTGKPCAHGHFAERLTKNRNCVICDRAYQDRYRRTHPAIKKMQRERYRQKHAEALRIKSKLYSIYGTCKVDEIRMLALPAPQAATC